MGNSQVKKEKEVPAGSVILPSPSKPAVPLTEEQKLLIQETWKILEKDIAEVGIIVFIQ